ncbi:helix-turn-helix domain-containing protein [Phocea massiliensis]|jgi:transcriptional regulator with XRE-family HTH domain|uniref:helix-turn-helix domain-containing protein n=1 Tax=Merdimmobilis hominis TaxID=2897707 RepID=UPI0006C79546|nr:helix-turn-helix transcriptional regulator [Merdimmobilis hominis]MCD4836808.1 helix-turn-helix domain-containing protein [Merdimmobilis hominis]PWL62163.1 MAG: XRE family transcriptional regulator [Oscillospiraceae bacterium]
MYFERIEQLREDSDLTQQEVADILVLNREVYRRYEKGEREIPVWAVIRLSKFYGTSTDYILGLTSERKPYKK